MKPINVVLCLPNWAIEVSNVNEEKSALWVILYNFGL